MAGRSALPASYQFSKLQKDLHAMGPKLRKQLRQDFYRIGQAAASDAKSRAGSWSRRIPSAISNRALIDMGRGKVGAEVRVSRQVQHARAYEGITQQGSTGYFRHPVYGNTQNWVSQRTRPYLWPAVRGRQNEMNRAVEEAVDKTARECGFH